MLAVRSVLFTTLFFLSALIGAIPVMLAGLFGHRASFAVVRGWARLVLWMLRVLCGLDYRVEGRENLPAEAAVVYIRHESAWETVAQMCLLPRQVWVLKRELMWIPLVGWGLIALRSIPIDRSSGRSAVTRVIARGTQHLQRGTWVVIFPEGTRMPVGETRRYGRSGAMLAVSAGVPLVPVAHNAGDFWPRRGWLKRPGVVQVRIGPPIETGDCTPDEVNTQARDWIQAELAKLR